MSIETAVPTASSGSSLLFSPTALTQRMSLVKPPHLPNMGVLLYDADLQLILAEGNILADLGMTAAELNEAAGKSLETNFFAEIAQELTPVLQAVFRDETLALEYLWNGRIFIISTYAVHNEQGEISLGMAVLQDVTTQRRTQDQLAERVTQLTLLSEVEGELAERLNIDYVMNLALDAAVRLSEAEGGFIALVGHDGNDAPAHPADYPEPASPPRQRFVQMRMIGNYPQATLDQLVESNQGIIARVFRERKSLFLPNVHDSADHAAVLPQTYSQIVIPLISRERVIGLLNLETSRPERFNLQTAEFLKLITARIATAIDNAWLYQQTVDQLKELQRLYEQVSKLEHLKTDMIRIAAHDLRNPLSVVMSYIGMLQLEMQKNADPKTMGMYAAQVDAAARQMRKIIQDILSLERIEEIATNANLVVCDFKELVEEVFEINRGSAMLRRQAYTLNLYAADTETKIEGDPVQLTEAVANLINNAIKYTPDHGRITVLLETQDDQLVFKVVDTGYGIKQNQQAKLFQPFFRARSEATRDIEGTGLGLHLVKNIIERHAGTMIFESTYGEGSTFGFKLPRLMNS